MAFLCSSSVVTWTSKIRHGFEMRVERRFARTRHVAVAVAVVVVVVVVTIASRQSKQRQKKKVTQVWWQRFAVEISES